MRKNKAESSGSQPAAVTEPTSPNTAASGRNWRPIIAMGVILFLAAFFRVIFSYGISAGSDFALTGGTEASNNLRFIESIINDGKIRFTDNYLNYPEGSLILVPILFDLVIAAFGMLFNVFLDNGIEAASLALALSGPVFGTLACIPMYFVGKEMFSSKTAGYLAAGFLALCPIFVQESVFSNGVGTSFAVFFLLWGILFLVKALKNTKEFGSDFKTPLIAGAFLAVAMLSTLDIRDLVIPIAFVMVAQVIIDRFKGKDPRTAAVVYAEALLVGAALPCVAYAVAGYWDALVSGVVCILVFTLGFALSYAFFYKKPWTLTLPICSIVFLALMLVLAIAVPGLYDCFIAGNSVYDPAYYDSLGRQYLSLSQLASYYGYVTYWFVFLVCLFMAFKFLKNASSALYTFTMVWLFAMTLTLGSDSIQAALAAPVFALGFAGVCKAVLDHVDFKSYFSAIKTGIGFKTKLRRVISPVPLISILVAVLLVAGPNMLQVVDAGISTNENDDYNDKISNITSTDKFGSLGYYVKTDDSWNVRAALSDSNVSGKGGVFATWLSFSDDVKIYADSKSFTDVYGNGSDVASNILLANGVDGTASAVLLVTALMSKGMNASALTNFPADVVSTIEGVLDKGDSYKVGDVTIRDIVKSDYDTYGKVSSDISEKNVIYLYLSNYIADNVSSYDINLAYDALNLRVPYIMVTGDMVPFFYNTSAVFNEMAYLNGYDLGTNGLADKFVSQSGWFYYSGVYDFTDAMYDSLLYRTYVGMSPSEAGYASLNSYLSALSAADSTVQMHPGYGLSNYEVAYWHVMYNPNSNATFDADGWVQMAATEAIAKQKIDGGIINYISGLPLILRYVPVANGDLVEGTVTDSSSNGIEGVRVSAVDSDGVVGANVVTDKDGKFKMFVRDESKTTLEYYLGGTSSKGGVLVGTSPATAPGLAGIASEVSAEIYLGALVVSPIVDGVTGKLSYDLTIENTATGEVDSYAAGSAHGLYFDIAIGTYKFTVKDGSTEVASSTLNIKEGIDSIVIAPTVYTYKITVKDEVGQKLSGLDVTMTASGAWPYYAIAATDSDGVAVFEGIPSGSYTVSVDGKYVAQEKFTVSSSSSRTVTATDGFTAEIEIPGFAGTKTVYIVGDAFSASYVADDSEFPLSVAVPKAWAFDSKYTVYAFNGGKIYVGTIDTSAASPLVSLAEENLSTIKGILKNSDGNAVKGTVSVFDGGNKFTFKTDADGNYVAYVPSGNHVVYATDGTDAFIGAQDLSSDKTLDISMVDADRVYSSSVRWSSVDVSYAMVNVTAGTDNIFFMTDDGDFSFYLPRGMSAEVSITPSGPTVFKTDSGSIKKSVSSSHSSSQSLSFSLESEKKVAIVNDVDPSLDTVKLKIGSDTKEVKDWVELLIDSASEQIELGSSNDSVYYKGTHYFDPTAVGASVNLSELLGVSDIVELTKRTVTVSDYSEDYNVKIFTDVENNKFTEIKSKETVRLDIGVADTCYALITNADNTKIYFAKLTGDAITIGSLAMDDAVSVNGYVGSNISATMMFEESAALKIPAEVSNGKYSVVLKKGVDYTAKIDSTLSGVEYGLDVSCTFDESRVKNFIAESEPITLKVDASAITDSVGTTTKVEFTIPDFENTSDKAETFKVTVGSGWTSYSVNPYFSEVISGIAVGPKDTCSGLKFTGYFNNSLYRLGTSDLSLSVDGTTDKYKIEFTGFPGEDGLVYVNKLSDVVGDHSYEYSYKIVNTGSKAVDVGLDVVYTSADWQMSYVYENYLGKYVKDALPTVTALPGETTVTLMFVPVSSSSDNVPSATVKFTAANMHTTTGDDITINGNEATSNASPDTAAVSVSEMSANGRGVYNSEGSMPTIVWVLAAISALLLILIFWMASKRGVFARRK